MSVPTGFDTDDEKYAAEVLDRLARDLEPIRAPDELLDAAVREGRTRRRRRRLGSGLAAVAAAVVVVAAVLLAVVQPRLGWSDLVAGPTADPGPTSAPTVWPPAVEDGTYDSRIHSRVAALYLARLSERSATAYAGRVERHEVAAALTFEPNPFLNARGWDLLLTATTPGNWDQPETGPEQSMFCARNVRDCRRTEGPGGTVLETWTEDADPVELRGDTVVGARYLRPDRTVVQVRGRADAFTLEQLTAIVRSPLWNVRAAPSDADQDAAEALTPFYLSL